TAARLAPVQLPNAYQAVTSPAKLRGQYYTPDALVAMMFEALPLAEEPFIVDPSCGDGSFLRGAVAAVARRFAGADPQAVARWWAPRTFTSTSCTYASAGCGGATRLPSSFRISCW